MACNIDETAVVILAAGTSGRMVFPKPLLRFNDDESFLERIINVYTKADIGKINLVVNSALYEILIRRNFDFLSQVELILNAEPELGRLHSIKLGLEHVDNEQYCFIQNVDEPFVDVKLIRALASKAGNKCCIKPDMQGVGGHPVLICPSIIKYIRVSENTNITLKDLLSEFDIVNVPVKNENYFLNINSVSDYRNFFNREPSSI